MRANLDNTPRISMALNVWDRADMITKRPILILIAEDDPDQSAMLSELLQLEGFRTQVVTRGDDALKRLLENHLDIAILDCRMPGMSGEKVLEAYRKTAKRPIPVILVSSFASPADLHRFKQDGAIACLSKPFSYEELRSTLSAVLTSEIGI